MSVVVDDVPVPEAKYGGTASLTEASQEDSDEFVVYRQRWVILAVFSLLNLSNALMWVTYAPISDLSESYFHASTTEVNLLAVVFLIFYPLGMALEVAVMKKYGLRVTLLVGSFLTAIGTLLRYIPAQAQAPPRVCYGIALLGQILGSFAQPLFVNMPAHISGAWFPQKERELSTTVGSLFSPIGNAVGNIFPVLLVSRAPNGSIVGMDQLFLVEWLICTASLGIAHVFVKDAPPSPPSRSAAATEGRSLSTSSASSLFSDCKTLLRDRNYLILFVSFSLGLAIFNSVLTLVNQLVQPYGYSNDDASNCSIAFIVCGLVGAGISSAVLEKTRRYAEVVKGGFFLCLCFIVLLVCMLRPNNEAGLVFAFAITGFALLPMLPSSFELAAEIVYPLPLDLAIGLLVMGGNVLGIPITFGLQGLMALPSWGPPPWSPSNFFAVFVVALASGLLFFFKGQTYLRMRLDQQGGGKSAAAADSPPVSNKLDSPLLQA